MDLAEAAHRSRGEIRLHELGYRRCEHCISFASQGEDVQPVATSEGWFHHPNCFFARDTYLRAHKLEVVEWDKAIRLWVWRDDVRRTQMKEEAAVLEAAAHPPPTGAPTALELRTALRHWWRVGRIDAATPEMFEQAQQAVADLAARIGPEVPPEVENAWDMLAWERYRSEVLEPGLRDLDDEKVVKLVERIAKASFTAARRVQRREGR